MLALARLIIGIAAIGEPQQLDYGEPIVYGQAARISNGAPLYQPLDRPPLTVAAYTPLYYKLASELQARVGPGFGPGRALSYAAGLATTAAVAWLAARYARSFWSGAFAAAIFVGLGFPGVVPWFALYRVDMVAEVLSLGAIVVLARGSSLNHVLVAGVLAGLAVLTKQTYLAAAIAGTLWLWGIQPRRALAFGATTLLIAGGVCVAEELATGAFVANAIAANVNPINLDEFAALVVQFSQTLGPALAIAALYVALARPWRSAPTRLLLLYWLASVLPLVGLVKFGAIYNYWIEFAASTAVLAALGISTTPGWRNNRARLIWRALVWLFTIDVVVFAPATVAAWASELSGGASLTGQEPTNGADFHALVELVRGMPDPVLGDPLDVVVLGGHPVELEPVIFAVLETQAQWNPEPLIRRICAGQISMLVLGAPIDSVAGLTWNGQPWWPPRVMRALQERMRPYGQRAGRFLYVPDQGIGEPASRPLHECAQ